jgi:hypothetical protein
VLWAKQYGVLWLCNNKRHENMNRFLCTNTWTEIVWDHKYSNWIKRDSCDMYCSGIWFIED